MSSVDFVYLLPSLEWLGNVTNVNFHLETLNEYFTMFLSTLSSWIFIPIWVSFVLPVFIVLLLYLSAFFVHVYGQFYGLKGAFTSSVWDVARYVLALVWYRHGRLWHGYEVEGLEHIPNEGPALLVYYHGALPIDYYYLLSTCLLTKNRLIRAVGDRFLFRIPGWELLLNVLQITPGTVSSCARILRDGHMLSIAPGGVCEAQFGDETYKLLWGKRVGFAKVAIEGQAPIIPIFTQNLREAFRAVSIGRSWFQKLYLKCKLPVIPIYGGFPVKLRTIIGKPIPYDPSLTPEQLATKTAAAIHSLIVENQRIPGSIILGLIDRIYSKPKQQ